MSNVLIIDASPLLYRIFNSQQIHLSWNGENTGMRFGFLRSVASYVKKTKADQTAICFDLPGSIQKAKGLPTYKSDRVFTDEKQKMYDLVPALREMIGLTKYAQLDAAGYEADDVIGALARAKSANGHNVTIVSPDNDMCQLLAHPRITIFVPGSKGARDTYKSEGYVKDYFGVWPKSLLIYRALAGDDSDNIAPAIAFERGAKKLLADKMNAFAHANGGWADPISETQKVVEQIRILTDDITLHDASTWVPTFCQNLHTMYLHAPPQITVQKGARDKEALRAIFERLAFNSMMDRINELCD